MELYKEVENAGRSSWNRVDRSGQANDIETVVGSNDTITPRERLGNLGAQSWNNSG